MLSSFEPFRISFAPLSIDEIYHGVDRPKNGAVVLMSGMVREQTQGRLVMALEYQAYEPMALKVFADISQEIHRRWSIVTRVMIHHRVGRLSVGDISILVAVGAPHRAEAFSACQFAIDTVKHEAPIWKKEYWRDGTSSWVSVGDCESESPRKAKSGRRV